MSVKIGIIGSLGILGSTHSYAFRKLGHIVKEYDLKLENSSMQDVLDTDLVFICVSTPTEDGSNSSSIIEKVVADLNALSYAGIVVIKSTPEPGTCQRLIDQHKFTQMKICYSAETLRERMAISDFIENNDVLYIGTNDDKIFETVKKVHGTYPKKVVQLTPTECELTKYFLNLYNINLVNYANSFAKLCQHLGVNYSNVKNAAVQKDYIKDVYLDHNSTFQAWAGPCFPLNIKVIQYIIEKNNLDIETFKFLISENEKFEKKVPDGMRLE